MLGDKLVHYKDNAYNAGGTNYPYFTVLVDKYGYIDNILLANSSKYTLVGFYVGMSYSSAQSHIRSMGLSYKGSRNGAYYYSIPGSAAGLSLSYTNNKVDLIAFLY